MPKRKRTKGTGTTEPKDKAMADTTTAPVDQVEPVEEEPNAKRGRRGKKRTDEANETGDATAPKLKKRESTREKIPDISHIDFSCDRKSESGKEFTLKIASWNVNGLRAWIEKNGHSYLEHEKPDILCLQETKCADDKIPDECKIDGYKAYWSAAETDGYSGTGMYSKTEPIKVTYGIGHEKHDKEGRTITAEFEKYYLVTAYVPNSGRGLPRLPYRADEWDIDFRAYLKKLDETKPVVLCGDLNVAHEEIDLSNPKGNKKTAGYTQQERDGFTNLLGEGFVDSFRHLYPDLKDAYSYWTYMGNCRAKNVGWRLDYFVVSSRLTDSICDSVIRKDVMGSDHCPVAIMLAL